MIHLHESMTVKVFPLVENQEEGLLVKEKKAGGKKQRKDK